jgi:hypothetical protein
MCFGSFSIPMAIPIPIPTRAVMASDRKNGEATSPSPFQSLLQGDEDIATPFRRSSSNLNLET